MLRSLASTVFLLCRSAFAGFIKHDCSRMAAALSYYTAFSLVPLLILAMAIAGLFVDPARVQGQVENDLETVVGDAGAEQVKQMLENADQLKISGLAGVLSVAGLCWGASGVVVQLQRSLNEVWGVKPDPSRSAVRAFFLKRLFSIAMVLSLGFVLVVSLAISAIAKAFNDQIAAALPPGIAKWAPELTNNAISLALLLLLFGAIFKVLPDALVRWRDVTMGSLLTAGLFVLGKFAIGLYLGSKNMQSAFGAAGSFALVLLWVYYSATILLLGAEFTVAWARQRGRAVVPQKGAVLLEPANGA